MKKRILQMKWTKRIVLIALLLGVAGLGKMYAQNFTVDDLNYQVNEDGVSVTVTGHINGTSATGSLVIPETVEYNGSNYSVTAIGDWAFSGCDGFTGSLTIGNSVTTIGSDAFSECVGFTGSLTIPDSVTTIGEFAFLGCSGFTSSLTIPNSVTMIGWGAFLGCSGFSGDLTIGNSVTTIGSDAFSECIGFTGSLTISNSVTTIGENAFYYCSGFTGNLTIGNSVTEIGEWSFAGCNGFTSMTILAETPPELGSYAFYNVNKSIPVYVPFGTVSAYQVASGWNEFTNIQEYGPCPISFADANVKAICVANWDTNGDGELSYAEAAAVTDLGQVFRGNTEITSFEELQYFIGLTSISSYAFYNCSNLSGSLYIPNSVTTISEGAFSNCSGFTGSLTIPNSVTTIGDNAFNGCRGFTGSLTIGNSVTSIGVQAFAYCSGFTGSLTIPDSVTEIGLNAFLYCQGFTGSLTIPNSVTTIGIQAFSGCSGFTGSLTISNSVTTIEKGTFRGCSGLTGSLIIPNSVTTIGSYAFYGCSGFTGDLAIPNSVTTIGDWAFYNCSGFTGELVIPNSVTTIGDWAFYGCSGFTGDLVISNSVTTIGNGAFYNCSGFTGNLNIPNSVTTIGDYAFEGCRGFTGNLTIGNSVTTIGDRAFSGCSGLTGGLVIPDSVTMIGGSAFGGCSGFTGSLTIPNSVITIGYRAFIGCSGLTGDLVIPSSVIEIGTNPFSGCSGIEQIMVDISNPNYDSRENCNAIIESSTNKLVSGCKNSIIIDDVATIGDYAFYYCSGFTGSLTIPNSVTTIGNYAFYYCSGFTGSLTIPNSVTTIGDRAFSGCSGFTGDLVIPNSVTTIGDEAFCVCSSFTGSLTIPNSVTSIGVLAFSGCSGLKEAMLYNYNPPSLEYYAFSNTSFPIYVPYESLNDYKTATNWSYYEDRIFPMAYITISGYGVGEGNYRFIASPLVENTAPTAVDNMITETPYDLYRFDQSEDDEWRNYKANMEDFVLENGQGYLYANAEDVNLIFKGAFNEDDMKEVGLAYDATATFAGWNLVGNPFPVSAYANKSYYTMNEDGTAIEPNTVSSATAIPACTGVMVMAEAEGDTVVFSTEAPEAATNQGCFQIELSQAVELVETPTRKQDGPSTGSGTLHDKAIVSFNAGDRLEKFVFNKENAVISIPQGGKELAIAYSNKQGEMPLNFKATKNGEYTLTINPEAVGLDYLHLIDNLTGADVDLLALQQAQGPANYTFEAKTTDYASRFRLVFSGKEADGPSSGSETFAFINNGNIIITGAEVGATLQIVDMTGHVVASCGGHTRCVPTTGMAKGVYVLRLINGDDVKTQKIVIR